eukprot:TRINITY_DN191_c9_g1_i1.p1 TRINITY_DN191_c9_g1~~TRINITY_DN191_c9_g1_i1.p1  ORF type:complete len:589 (+),score=102.20 TRINITY_DN191_c9_g1_i1:71-1768(+)
MDHSKKKCCTSLAFRDSVKIEGLACQCIVGVKEPERLHRQKVVIEVEMFLDTSSCSLCDDLQRTISYATVSREVHKYAEVSQHGLLETLAHGIARIVCMNFSVPECRVRIEKPRAVPLADQAVVEILRKRSFFTSEIANNHIGSNSQFASLRPNYTETSPTGQSVAFLALGSNVGNTFENLSNAVDRLKSSGVAVDGRVITSGMFVTPATYETDQEDFCNAVVACRTTMDPFLLLRTVKEIEETLGRVTTYRNGPRVIDIDIIFHGSTVLKSDILTIPHENLHKRLFVLLPLCDIAPINMHHPVLDLPLRDLTNSLLSNTLGRIPGEEDASKIRRIIPFVKTKSSKSKTAVVAQVHSESELNTEVKAGADAVLVQDKSLAEMYLKKRVNDEQQAPLIFFTDSGRVDDCLNLLNQENTIDAVYLSFTVLSSDKLKEIAEKVSSKRLTIILELNGPGSRVADATDYVSLLEGLGVSRWQITIDPGLTNDPKALQKYMTTPPIIIPYPKCLHLASDNLMIGGQTIDPTVLVSAAIQTKADMVIVKSVIPVKNVAESADTLYKSSTPEI